ncbi:helix-turn-helix domain-containing protein [Microbacterium esteraromaticum]|uniref:helix-turn-helix domain-containing protein n=1 Tax=Microbacterium esteraromaticum TaxID=57043 RepID=UPI000B34E46C|nr:helix-turn-helix domain-containing protein [Microbacterium esteraromaticum]
MRQEVPGAGERERVPPATARFRIERGEAASRSRSDQAVETESFIWCPNREKTVSSFVTLKSLISRGSSEGQGVSVSSLAVPRSDVRGPVVTPIETAGTPVAPETLQAMVAAYESRASLISIAREHRLGKETVRDLLVDAGVRIRRQGLDDEQVAHAVRGYESGLTTREIARELGIGHSMVWRALKRAEVESRPNTRRVGRKLSKQ